MGTRYPGRPQEDNRTRIVGVRLPTWQREKIEEVAKEFNMSISDIMREALSVWFNLNSEKRGD